MTRKTAPEVIEGLGQFKAGRGAIVTDWHSTRAGAVAAYKRQARQGVEYLLGQAEIPGCEPSESNRGRRLSMAPLRSSKSQKACDFGLFAERGQIDIEDLT